MGKTKKKPVRKKKELTTIERFEQAVKEGKIAQRPILEGEGKIDEQKLSSSRRQTVDGTVQLGVAYGMTFSDDVSNTKMSNWFRVDRWMVVNADPNHVEEVHDIVERYVEDKVVDYYNMIMDSIN